MRCQLTLLLALAGLGLQTTGDATLPFSIMASAPERPGGRIDAIAVTFIVPADFAPAGSFEVLQLSEEPNTDAWRLVARRVVDAANPVVRLEGTPGTVSLLVVRQTWAVGYGLHGPFNWPSTAGSFPVVLTRARTLRAQLPAPVDSAQVRWVSVAAQPHISLPCRRVRSAAIECVGVGLTDAGVLLAGDSTGAAWFAASPATGAPRTVEELIFRRAPWVTLFDLRVPSGSSDRTLLNASTWRSRRPSGGSRSSRIVLESLPGYSIFWLTPTSFLLAGPHPPDDATLQLEGPAIATKRIGLAAFRVHPPDQPVLVTTNPGSGLLGHLRFRDGRPVPGALIVVSEFLDSDGDVHPTRDGAAFRRRVQELSTDDDGGFGAAGLEYREYEWLAVHPQYGRVAIVSLPLSGLVLTLPPTRTVVGRILRDRLPAEGVPVTVMPHVVDLASGADPLEQMGMETQSDATGRFRVAVSQGGAGEVRVGSNATGIVRRAFAAGGGTTVIDVGDVELPGPRRVDVLVDGVDDCELAAVGPLGRVGLQIVVATRQLGGIHRLELPEAGHWSLALTCAGVDVTLEPAFVNVAPGETRQTIGATVVGR